MKICFVYIGLLLLFKASKGHNEIYSSSKDNSDNESEVEECSKPLDNMDAELSHSCNYRGSILPELIYRWRSGNGCYIYIQPHLFKHDVPPAIILTCKYKEYDVPCFKKITPTGWKCFPIDINIQPSYEEVKRTVVSDAVVHKWQRCINSAMSCCRDHMHLDTLKPGPQRCPTEWDGWTCWFPGHSGTNSEAVCPEFAYSYRGPTCKHYCAKTCDRNGTWNPNSDYSSCSLSPRLLSRLHLHVAWLSCSLVAAIPALLILNTFKDTKLKLHRNLLGAIVIRNIFVIINKSMIIKEELVSSGPTIMSENGGFCKTLTVFEKLAAQAVFSCMFMEGFYLHRKIVAVFKKDVNIKCAYIVFSVITLIPVIIWICLMATLNNSKCWLVYEISGIEWSLNGPRITILIINTFLYFDILRIFFTKMKTEDNGNKLNTAKATLFLLPLFGIQFFFTFWYPATSSCEWEQFYFMFAYSLDGLQGVVVAVLYCYMNKEVQNRIRVWFQRVRQTWDNKRSQRTKINNLRRRRTSTKAEFDNQEGQNNRLSCRDSGVDITYLNNLDNDNQSNKIVQFEMTDLPKCMKSPEEISFTSVTFDEDAGKVEQIRKKHLDSLAECFNRHVTEINAVNTNTINDTIVCEQNINENHNEEDHRRCYTISLGEIGRLKIFENLELSMTGSLDNLEMVRKKLGGYSKVDTHEVCTVSVTGTSQDKEGEPLDALESEHDDKVMFDPDKMCPNRKSTEKIVFL